MTVGQHHAPAQVEATEQTRQYLWSSPERERSRRMPGAVVFLIAVALIGAVGMLYLLQTNHVANLGYEMSQLQTEREAALVDQQKLSAQIAEKQALPSVERTARIELGMRPIDDYIYLDVELPPLEPEAPEQPPAKADKRSTLERFWSRLTGSSTESQETTPDD